MCLTAPRLIASGLVLRAFVAFFGYVFIALWGAYLANDPKSKRGVGIGAFNLVRREAYERIGTMRALSLRPDDMAVQIVRAVLAKVPELKNGTLIAQRSDAATDNTVLGQTPATTTTK